MSTDAGLLDQQDSLSSLRSKFSLPEGMIYLDGNSLGPLPKAVKSRVDQVMTEQWGNSLITSWNKHQWINLPQRTGDRIGALIGAAPGQTLCCDSISINLFKVLAVALQLRPGTVVLSTEDNFPTDLYMVQGLRDLFSARSIELKLVAESELTASINNDVAAVLVTHVNFRTGALLDIEQLTAKAHACHAAMIVDLAHSAGALPVALDAWQVDFAVGCTYKYLNAGPGAPAFLYVAKRHLGKAAQPLYGWMGHADAFAFSPSYQPAQDISQYLTGTPSILAMSAVDAALDVFAQTNMQAIRDKSMQLGMVFQSEIARRGLDQYLTLMSPSAPQARGSQISYAHPHAYAICQALIADGVIGDFRAPDYLRLGFTPLYTSFADVFMAVDRLERIMQDEVYLEDKFQRRQKVT
ncbi:MAG: kynureninase [Idiomarina sp.]|nr:kynureninase [Idiomarina sp.]